MLKKSLLGLSVLAVSALSGCGSLTGFSNAGTDFSCSDVSGQPSCRNISEVYTGGNKEQTLTADTATNFISDQSSAEGLQPFFESNREALANAPSGPGKIISATEALAKEESLLNSKNNTVSKNPQFAVIAPATPWRKPETIFRVWMAPFTDADGDLHDQRYMYVKVIEAGWTQPTIGELAKPRSPYRPVHPLSDNSEKPVETPKKTNLLNVLQNQKS